MRRPSSSAMVRLMCAAMCMRWVCCCSTYCAKRRPPPQRFKAASVRMGFPNRCAMWLPRRRRSTLPIGSGRWELCARRSCTRSGAPSIFEGDLLLLVRVVCGALAIFRVAIWLPKQVVRTIPDTSLVSDWMTLYGPAALGMPPIPISLASRLVRQSRLCRLQRLVHLRCVTPRSGEDSRLLRMAQKSPFDGCGGFWSGISHRLPLGVGVAWDILLAAWGAVMAFACIASGMNPQGDMARLPAVACAVSYVCVWLVMGWPIPLLVDTRPIEKLFPLFERPSLKQRVVAAAGMAGVAFAVLTLIGILFLRES